MVGREAAQKKTLVENVYVHLKFSLKICIIFSSVAQLCPTLCDPMDCNGLQHARPPCPSPTFLSLLKLMPIELVMSSNHLIFCHPLLLPPSIFPSIRVFSNKSVLHIRWSNIEVSASASSPFNRYSGLISFRMDWLDLLAVQRTLKILLQHHRSKA